MRQSEYNQLNFLIDYFKVISFGFEFISYYSKTVKTDHVKIISDHFKTVSVQ